MNNLLGNELKHYINNTCCNISKADYIYPHEIDLGLYNIFRAAVVLLRQRLIEQCK